MNDNFSSNSPGRFGYAFMAAGGMIFLIMILVAISGISFSKEENNRHNNKSNPTVNDVVFHEINHHFMPSLQKGGEVDSLLNKVFGENLKEIIDTVVVFDWDREALHFYAVMKDSIGFYEYKDHKLSKYFLKKEY